MPRQRTDDATVPVLQAILRSLTLLGIGDTVPPVEADTASEEARRALVGINEQIGFIEREWQRLAMDQNLLERAQMDLQEQLLTIQRQSEVIRQLQAPVLEIWDGVLCVPIVGSLDDVHGAELADTVLAEVSRRRARCVILDVTGLENVDTGTATRFLEMAAAVGLLGARCMLTGVSPAVARSLIGLGADLGAVETCRTLREALGRLIG